MILVIDNYDSFTFNLVQMLGVAGAEVAVLRNDVVDVDAIRRLAPRGVVISPGPSHPDRAGNVPALVRALIDAAEAGGAIVPVLGVCLGHQVLARAFGARVERAPRPVHGKTASVEHDGRGVFDGVESPAMVARYHSLAVVEETLPACLRVSARAEDGVVMGLRHAALPLEGVQFHPESILTTSGAAMLANFLEATRAATPSTNTAAKAEGIHA